MSQADRITAEINAKYPNDSERRFYELSLGLIYMTPSLIINGFLYS